MSVKVLLGPPGTGKTTTILNRIDDLVQGGIRSDEIAFVSFTKSACNEAKERACDRFNLEAEHLPYFRTIHSMAFALIGGRQAGAVMGEKEWKAFGESCRYEFSDERQTETPFFTAFNTDGDQFRSIYDMSRICMCSIDQAMIRVSGRGIRVRREHVVEYAARLKAYKIQHGLIDFTDMLEKSLASPKKPVVLRAFVDEAQDLCALQHALVRHWFLNSSMCQETTIAGDDDQTIFTWAGAEPGAIIDLAREHGSQILDQSYRIPSSVHEFAQSIIGQNKNRIPKKYLPRKERGVVRSVKRTFEAIGDNEGSTMALVRNIYLSGQFYEEAMSRGEVFSSEIGRKAPLERAGIKGAYLAVACLRDGKAALAGHFSDFIEQVPSRIDGHALLPRGVKTRADENRQIVTLERAYSEFGLKDFLEPILKSARPFSISLLRLPPEERHYLDKVLAKEGAKLPDKPTITITTMHRSKGREADNVVVACDMARASAEELAHGDHESENRVAYVAVTRARHQLILLEPETKNHYPYLAHMKKAK